MGKMKLGKRNGACDVRRHSCRSRIMEEGFFECTLFYYCYEKTAYVTETLKSHLADFTSVSQLVSQNEKVHTRWGWSHCDVNVLILIALQ